ncbi:hypothetical protein B5807_09972 [Epicoccum nigrum]|uniref:Tyrosinase copper-binding domain-containing protein n=1 Tax=Epicoccum nigrum TaxID=105696 RepID=A0A1Y2LV59_EPING|nr:hypothetical protein B5807_09972 [Epicoccum nigrum]
MRFSPLAIVALIGGANAAPSPLKHGEQEALADKAMTNIGEHVAANGYANPNCTLKNAAVRKEWSALTKPERKNYIDAVKCLNKKPALTPASVAAGAKSRFDDFVVTHVIQTYWVHGTANFLAWHRYYTWAYEQLLRNECGYKGYLPYHNWAWWADDLSKSPLLDGSDTSIGGDGEYIPGRNYTCVGNVARCYIKLQPGRGGGCIKSGPMKDWIMNLGPIDTKWPNIKKNPSPDGLGYNPRCLSRDFMSQASMGATDKTVSDLLKNSNDIHTFQTLVQGDFINQYIGVHSAGHYSIGGDAGTDFFNSPSDPYFYFHHTQIDRIWWIWQNQDIKNRQYALADTLTFLNSPPSRNGTLNDTMSLGSVFEETFPNITQGDAMSTMNGPFCYVYA